MKNSYIVVPQTIQLENGKWMDIIKQKIYLEHMILMFNKLFYHKMKCLYIVGQKIKLSGNGM